MPRQQEWAIVAKLFLTSQHCNGCVYRKCWEEVHPYGEGRASEALTECTLGQRPYDSPRACGAFQDYLTDNEGEL
jgi:hypothetical protein